MKLKFRLISVFLLISIYCFAILDIKKSPVHSDINNISSNPQEQFFSDLSAKLLSHTSTSYNTVKVSNKVPNSGSNKPFSGIWAVLTKTLKLLFESEYSQYSRNAQNFCIQVRNSELLFPFQYFW